MHDESAKTINSISKNTLMEHLSISYDEVTPGRVVASMPVDHRTHQPMGRLHGGASMALAESAASAGSFAITDTSKFMVLGTEINGSHVGSATSGKVIAEALLIHHGKSTHVWDVKIRTEAGKLVSVVRMTMSIVPIHR